MFTRIPGNFLEDSAECYYFNIPGNAQEDFEESKFRFILWNLALFLSNSANKMRKNKGIFSALLITTYNLSPMLKYCFSSTFFLSLFFLLSRKGCNYYAQVQGYQKTLPQLRGLKNTPNRVGTINLKFEN